MNPLQQFIQSKVTSAVGRPTQSMSSTQPTPSMPQPSMMDRLRGAGSSVMDSLRQAGADRLASNAQPGSLGPQLRVSQGTLPNPFSETVGGRLMSGDPQGAAQALPGALMGLAVHGAPGSPKPTKRLVPMDEFAARHISSMLKKNTPYGFIDEQSLLGDIKSILNPNVKLPQSFNSATFGEVYRGVMKHLGLDADDIPNADFVKNLAKAYMEMFEGSHKLPPGSQPKTLK